MPRLEEAILNTRGLPGWVCVGHADPDDQVRVWLEYPGHRLDISRCHRMVALAPLVIAIGLENDVQNGAIVVTENQPGGSILGRIEVNLQRKIQACGVPVALFEAGASRNRCMPLLRGAAIRSWESWKAARDPNPRNIRMTPSDMFAMWILHNAPRPVVAVSCGSPERGNLFPMDLVGSLTDECYVLGLHSSSPAIPVLRESGKIAVSVMPLCAKNAVYGLGKNHREALLDLRALPMTTLPSPLFGIPALAQALAVYDLALETVIDLGSHQLFVTRVKSFERKSAELQMCHVHRLYQQYLMERGRALQTA